MSKELVNGLIPEYKVPVDSEGYLQSFDLKESKEIKEFFDKFGFIIINNILTPDECKETIDDIWNWIEDKCSSIKRKDVSTWENTHWRRTGLFDEGIIGYDPIWTQRSILNRKNPNLAKAGSILLERDDLCVNHDRYGLFRPTVGEQSGKKTKKSEWGTNLNLHLDMNPWSFCEKKKPILMIKKLWQVYAITIHRILSQKIITLECWRIIKCISKD